MLLVDRCGVRRMTHPFRRLAWSCGPTRGIPPTPSSSPTAAANLSSDNFDRASTTLLQNSTAITLRAFAWILLGTTKSIIIIRLRKLSIAAPTGDVTTAHQLSVPQKAHHAFDKGMAKADSKADYQGAIQEFQRTISNYPAYYDLAAALQLPYVRL